MFRYEQWNKATACDTEKSILKTMDHINKDREGALDTDECDDLKDCAMALKDIWKTRWLMMQCAMLWDQMYAEPKPQKVALAGKKMRDEHYNDGAPVGPMYGKSHMVPKSADDVIHSRK